jgi:hypothetical protein
MAISTTVLAEQDSIVTDANGDYIITYKSYLGWQKVKWVPSTKINPKIKFIVSPDESRPDRFTYRYSLRNGQDSRQYLVGFNLVARSVSTTDTDQPMGWIGGAVINHAAGEGFIVGWHFRRYGGPWEAGVKPGSAISGFRLYSSDLPGIGQVEFGGARPGGQGFPDEGPNEVDNPTIIEEFNRIIDKDYVARFAAVPRIFVPVPYDAAVVLTGIKSHLDADLVSLKLVDATLVSELVRWLDAAIAAAKGGNSKALRSALQEARKLLKREYPDIDKENEEETDDKGKQKSSRIDRLAAWVLDFDLRYVEQRIQGRE